MTVQKNFKALVRNRMKKTGERYATARRQLLSNKLPADKTYPSHLPGNVPLATAFRILINHSGINLPDGSAISEATALGLTGGIGAGVFAFYYDEFSSFYVAGRHLWYDDVACLKTACQRLGIKPEIKEFGGAGPAEKGLVSLLKEGPVIAWLDMGSLPHRGLPASWSGGGYHLVTVYQSDAEGETVFGDLADEPVHLETSLFTKARGRIKKDKFRLLAMQPPSGNPSLPDALAGGLAACAEGLVRGRIKNFTIKSFDAWADALHGASGKDSWEKMFPPGHRLWRGLTSMFEFIEHFGSGGGLMRPLFSQTLRESALILNKPALLQLADSYEAQGEKWTALAEAALPENVSAFAQAMKLITAKEEAVLSGTETEARRACDALEALGNQNTSSFPLSREEADELRKRLQVQAKIIAAEEAKLAEMLGSAL